VDPTTRLATRIVDAVKSIRTGEIDPLDFRLTEAYQELQTIAEEVDRRLDIDELLNEILGSKVTRVQELARILDAPEILVEKVRKMTPRQLAALISYKQPLSVMDLEVGSLESAYQHLTSIIEAHSQPKPQDSVPEMSGLPAGFMFESEESVFIADLNRFVKSIPRKKPISLDALLATKDFDDFLRRFLFVVVLVSRGMVTYDPTNRTVMRS
jgi:hypothetical protein